MVPDPKSNKSRLDAVDHSLYRLNKSIAQAWERTTKIPTRSLRRWLYVAGSLSSMAALANWNMYVCAPIAAMWAMKTGNPDIYTPKSGNDSDIESEIGIPGKVYKFFRIFSYSAGCVKTVTGLGFLVHGIMNKDLESLMASTILVPMGMGLSTGVAADYMAIDDYSKATADKKPMSENNKINPNSECTVGISQTLEETMGRSLIPYQPSKVLRSE